MRVLVFQHVAGEHPAAFSDHIAAAGDSMHVVRFFAADPIPSLNAFDALIVMGGPMDVWETETYPWLAIEKTAIRQWVLNLGRPYLGICLGHQLLVDALGGTCARLTTPAIAVGPVSKTETKDPIFDRLPSAFPALQWHGVAPTHLPDDCAILAATPNCPYQAIRVGPHAWGVQFHPEITPGLVTGWLGDTGNMQVAVEWLGSQAAAQSFAADCENHCNTALEQSAALYAGLRAAALSNSAYIPS